MPEIVLFPGLLEEHEDVLRFFHPVRYHPRTTRGSHGHVPSQNFFHVFHLATPQVVFQLLAFTCELQFCDKQLEFSDYNPSSGAIVLEDHFSVVL